jgi:hypothetical protein
MRRAMPGYRSLIYALCSFLLLGQMTGAHLHVCLDGQEPPVQLHLAGASEQHDESELSRPHSDREVALNRGSSTTGKNLQLDLPLAACAVHALQLAPATRQIAVPCFDQVASYTAARELLPPSRGPPHIA